MSMRFLSLTSTIISRITFGKDYISIEFTSVDFCWLLHEAVALLASLFFGDHTPLLGSMIDHSIGFPTRIQRLIKELDSFYEIIIKEHLVRDQGDSKDQDIINILLQKREDNKSSPLDINTNHIKAVIMEHVLAKYFHLQSISR